MGKRKAAQTGMVRYSAFLRRDQLAALRSEQDRSGLTVSQQIRRALDAALGTKPPARRRS